MVRIISALILAVTAACASAQEPLKLVDNPPERYTVIKGDTLWDISGRFLKQPWRWPELWRLNQEQIKNPHLIYPGDVVYLDYSDGTPRLRLGKPVGSQSGQMASAQPKVYATQRSANIPSIPANAIEPFISQPLIVEENELAGAARIIASQEDRIMLGGGDSFYATGIPDASVEKWNVFRPGKALKDPSTGKPIAYEAYYLGTARLTKPGEPATLRVVTGKEEIARGDRLLPAPTPALVDYAPRRPEVTIDGRVVSIYGGLREGGPKSVVAFNQGSRQGVEVGHVLAMSRNRVSTNIEASGRVVETPVPEERYALVFVFRVFNDISYGLVMESSKAVIVGDYLRNP